MVDQPATAKLNENRTQDRASQPREPGSSNLTAPIIDRNANDLAIRISKPLEASSSYGSLEIDDQPTPSQVEKSSAGFSKQDGNLHIALPKEIQGQTPQIENRANGLKVSTWGDKDKPTYQLWQYTSGTANGAEVLFQRIGDKLEIDSMLEAANPPGIGTRDFIQVHRDGAKVKSLVVTSSDTGKATTFKIDEEENITGVDVFADSKDHPPGYKIQKGGEGGFGVRMTTSMYVDLSSYFESTFNNNKRSIKQRLAAPPEKSPDGLETLPAGSSVKAKYFQKGDAPARLLSTNVSFPEGSPGNVKTRFWGNLAKVGEPQKLWLEGERFRTPQSVTPQTLHLTGDVQAVANISGWLMNSSPAALKPGEAPKITLLRQVPANGDTPAGSEEFAVWTLNQERTKVISQEIIPKDDRSRDAFPDEVPF
jgi:hypothetical protein